MQFTYLFHFELFIGKGSFGEIFLASDDISKPVTSDNAKFVVKIEPHKSGPLFVEIHCLIKAGKPSRKLNEIDNIYSNLVLIFFFSK